MNNKKNPKRCAKPLFIFSILTTIVIFAFLLTNEKESKKKS